ncbi:MAG: hypothetical protein DCF29_08680 [Alphaproteobacteria bacterium]|nr:MAG: hypothetical protein DCF29_08680 [Alphaproteobacteria bacterium]
MGVCLAAAGVAHAQDAQTYLYDGNGRLVASTLARFGGGVMTSYNLDAADNRLSRNAVPVSTTPTPNILAYPRTLLPTQKLTSSNGLYTLTFETSGNLVIAGPSGMLWNSCTGQGRSTYLFMGSDGNLLLHDTRFFTIWNTQTGGNPGALLMLRDDGVAEIKVPGGPSLWTSVTPCA